MPVDAAYKAGFMDKCAELGLSKSAALPNLLLNVPLGLLSLPQMYTGAKDTIEGLRGGSLKQTVGGLGNVALGGLGAAWGHHSLGKGLAELGQGMKALKGTENSMSHYVANSPRSRYFDPASPQHLPTWLPEGLRSTAAKVVHPFWKGDVAGMNALNKLESSPRLADWLERTGSHSSFHSPFSRASGSNSAMFATVGLSPVSDAMSQSGAADVERARGMHAARAMSTAAPQSLYDRVAPYLSHPLNVNVQPFDRAAVNAMI